MADQYLKEAFSKIAAPKELKSLVKGVFDKLLEKTFMYVKQKYLDQVLQKKKSKQKRKSLNSSPSSRLAPTSQIREEHVADFKQKEEETREFVKKLKKEQKERERRQKEREEEERQRISQEENLQKLRQQEMALKLEEEKLKRISELKEKSSKRKKETKDLIELGNSEYKKVVSSKPLHEIIEEKYMSKVLMPELERHKLELAKKRELFQPINRSAILEHARRHDQTMEEHDAQRRNMSQEGNYDATKLRSKFTLAYIEEKKRRKQEMEKESMEKKNLVEKKKQYAELVLEMYQPTIDPAKQLELKIIKEKMRDSSAKLMKKRSAKSLSANEGGSEGEKAQQIKKTWKKNKMLPEPVKKKEPVKIDWLAEKRENRKNQNSADRLKDMEWSEGLTEDKIKNKVKNIEKEMRKQEIKLEVANPTNIKGIEATEHVSNMLISSIKGKLALLEKN